MNTQKSAFEAWYDSYDTRTPQDLFDRWLARKAWQAALASPEVQALRDALQEVVDAADGKGWEQIDPSFSKQRAALAAMEKQDD